MRRVLREKPNMRQRQKTEKTEIAAHPGNAETYDFSRIEPVKESPLAGRKICILGSSVAYGSASLASAVGEYLAARFGAALTKEAVSGTTLAEIGEASYVRRMRERIPAQEHFDLFLCQLSTNDASRGVPLGEISEGKRREDFDTSTVTGAMEYIISYARETWRCPVAFFTGARYESAAYGAMVARLLELKEKWGICVMDLWSGDAFNRLTQKERALYMYDAIHPTKAGYRDWWGPEISRQLVGQLVGQLVVQPAGQPAGIF